MKRIVIAAVLFWVFGTGILPGILKAGEQQNEPAGDDLLSWVLEQEKPFFSEEDREHARTAVNGFIAELKRLDLASKSPPEKIDAVNRILFGGNRFQMDPEVPSLNDEPEFSEGYPSRFREEASPRRHLPLFTSLLTDGIGQCYSFSLLYLIVGRAVGMNVQAVYVPRHLFVRFREDQFVRNIETTNMGIEVTDETYCRVLHLNPDAVARGVYLADLSLQRFREFCKLQCTNGYLYQGETAKALSLLRALATRSPDFLTARLDLGRLLVGSGDLAGARAEAEAVLKIDPLRVGAHRLLFIVAGREEKFSEAVSRLDRVLAIHPRNYFALLEAGKLLVTTDAPSKAIEYLDRAEKQYPDNAQLMYNQATARFLRGDSPAEVERYLKKALELDSKDPNAWFAFGEFLVKTGKFGEGIQKLKEAVRISPKYLLARRVLAVAYTYKMQFREAEEQLEAVPEEAREATDFFYLGVARLYQGKTDGVESYLEKSRPLGATGGDMRVPFVLLRIIQEQYEKAAEEIAEGQKADPETSSRLMALSAFLDFRKGEADKAKAKLETYGNAVERRQDQTDLCWLFREIEILKAYRFGILVVDQMVDREGFRCYLFKRGYYFDLAGDADKAVADYTDYLSECEKDPEAWWAGNRDWAASRLKKLKKN